MDEHVLEPKLKVTLLHQAIKDAVTQEFLVQLRIIELLLLDILLLQLLRSHIH